MSLSFSFDQHAPAAIAHALRLRGLNVLQVLADGHDRAEDEQVLLRATSLGRVLFTQDEDLLALAHRYQTEERHFAGVVYAHQMRVSISQCIAALEIISKASSAEELSIEDLPFPPDNAQQPRFGRRRRPAKAPFSAWTVPGGALPSTDYES